MRIDAHQHFWKRSRGDYEWLTSDLAPLDRDFLPIDLAPIAARLGIAASVLVQAAATTAETDFLLDLAGQHPSIRAVVGWVDFESADAQAHLEQWARHPAFRGVRPMLQDLPDPEWILQSRFAPLFDTMIALDLGLDALIRPAHLPVIETLLARHPALRLVIDHGAKPAIADDGWQPWADHLARIARHTGAFCKLSGLVTEASHGSMAAVRPYAAHLFNCFGAERLMWGSDWPMLLLASDYDQWFEDARRLIAPQGEAAVEAVFGGTAARFYQLEKGQG